MVILRQLELEACDSPIRAPLDAVGGTRLDAAKVEDTRECVDHVVGLGGREPAALEQLADGFGLGNVAVDGRDARVGLGGASKRRRRDRHARRGAASARLLLDRTHARLLVPHEDVEVEQDEASKHEDHQRATSPRRRGGIQLGVCRPFLARRRASTDHGLETSAISRPFSRPHFLAKDPMATPRSDLPPREQLELFSESGQGARHDMAKKSGKPAKSSGGGGRGNEGGGGGTGSPGSPGTPGTFDASLEAEARRRYLNYALSVITSRALPDVRDGLKPVQRRILYAMLHDNHLRPDAKYRKSATVVGNVIGKYHPHGDTAVYATMVRLAQDWAMRMPLVDGSGNFGSLDGDEAAAMRYTECRLAPPAMALLGELDSETVDMRANYDGTTEEPVVLPARYPNLLVNGSTGIAVGMATNIPPHNLREMIDAVVALSKDRKIDHVALMSHIKGPDFPTGGQLLNNKVELRQIYKEGSGALRVRGEYKLEEKKRGGTDIVITSIPYAVSTSDIVTRIADIIISRKLPYLLDVRNESTNDARIVLEIKKDADPELVMAYLFKNTPLQQSFHVNLTCLVPPELLDEAAPVGSPPQPKKLGIKEMLEHFLDFRIITTERR